MFIVNTVNTLIYVTYIANVLKYGGSAQKCCGPKLYSSELHYQPWFKNVDLPYLPHHNFFDFDLPEPSLPTNR